MLPFADRHAELAGDLSQVLIRELRGKTVDEEEKSDLWTAYVDARSWRRWGPGGAGGDRRQPVVTS